MQKIISKENFPEVTNFSDVLKNCSNLTEEMSRNSGTIKELLSTLSDKLPEKRVYKKPIRNRQDAQKNHVNQMLDYYMQTQNQMQMGTPKMQMVGGFQNQNPFMVLQKNQMNSFNGQVFFQNQGRMM